MRIDDRKTYGAAFRDVAQRPNDRAQIKTVKIITATMTGNATTLAPVPVGSRTTTQEPARNPSATEATNATTNPFIRKLNIFLHLISKRYAQLPQRHRLAFVERRRIFTVDVVVENVPLPRSDR